MYKDTDFRTHSYYLTIVYSLIGVTILRWCHLVLCICDNKLWNWLFKRTLGKTEKMLKSCAMLLWLSLSYIYIIIIYRVVDTQVHVGFDYNIAT